MALAVCVIRKRRWPLLWEMLLIEWKEWTELDGELRQGARTDAVSIQLCVHPSGNALSDIGRKLNRKTMSIALTSMPERKSLIVHTKRPTDEMDLAAKWRKHLKQSPHNRLSITLKGNPGKMQENCKKIAFRCVAYKACANKMMVSPEISRINCNDAFIQRF